jgi:penicillin-binding protein 1C
MTLVLRSLLVFSLVLFAESACLSAAIPSFAQIKAARTSSEALILDRYGEVIHEMRIDLMGRRLDWKNLQEISPSLQRAVIQSEDRRFYQHSVVDWRALSYAFLTNWFSAHPRGASTITMQLAALIEKRRPIPARYNWRQKWLQLQKAREIEQRWSKSEILEAYLNLISFRGELQGVTAAARGLFEKEPHGLADDDAWILAAR